MHRVLGFALLLSAFGLAGCRTGIKPHTARIARGAGYELQLERSFNAAGVSDPSRGAQRMLMRVGAFPEGSRILWAHVARADSAACTESVCPARVRIRDRTPQSSLVQPRSGEMLEVDLSLGAWSFALSGPSRLDLALEDRSGKVKCASFALIGELPEQRWDAVGSWTLESVLNFEFFMQRVDGLDGLVLVGMEVGKWLGPLRVHVGSGAGASECARGVCAPMKSDTAKGNPNEKYYVPLLAGLGGTLFQLGPVAFEGKLQYRVAWTAAETLEGLRRVFLHGPLATASIVFTSPNPIAPGIPGGTRRGVGVGAQLPLGYVMSARGNGSFSVGASLMLMFPIH